MHITGEVRVDKKSDVFLIKLGVDYLILFGREGVSDLV